MLLRRTSPAQGEEGSAVSLADASDHCRVTGTDEAGEIEAYLLAALNMVAERTGRALSLETWALSVGSVSGDLCLPKAPVRQVTAITYYDAAGVSQSAAVADFLLIKDDDRAILRPKPDKAWPTLQDRPDALTVTFEAGYTTMPGALRVAVLQIVGHLYGHREAVGEAAKAEIPMGARDMIDLYRLGWFAA